MEILCSDSSVLSLCYLRDPSHSHTFKQAILSWVHLVPLFFPSAAWGVILSPWTLTQHKPTFDSCCGFSFFSLRSPELSGSCTIYLMLYCSGYHCAPKMFSSYSITLSLRLIIILTYYSLLCLLNLTFGCAVQGSRHIWCPEAEVLCVEKKNLFVNLSL